MSGIFTFGAPVGRTGAPPPVAGELSYPLVGTRQLNWGSGHLDAYPGGVEEKYRIGSKYDYVIVGPWRQWSYGGISTPTLAAKYKSKAQEVSTARASWRAVTPRIYLYTKLNERLDDGGAWADVAEKLTSEQWWLYNTSGQRTILGFSANEYYTNPTIYTDVDGSGRRYPEYLVDAWTGETGTDYVPDSSYDGMEADNCAWNPYNSASSGQGQGDYNLDGTADGNNATCRGWYADAHVAYFDAWAAKRPSWIGHIGGNISNQCTVGNDPQVPQWQGTMDFAYAEGMRGHSWSVAGYPGYSGWGSFATLMEIYQRCDWNTGNNDGTGVWFSWEVSQRESNNTQVLRYGLAACLMRNGIFATNDTHADSGDTGYGETYWWDEFDIELGQPIDAVQTSSWSQGVWRREFDNGLVLCNPKGNGQQTVSVGSGWKSFSGSQDPAVNNGAVKTSVTLADSDGIVLVRT